MNPKLKTWTYEDRSDWPDFDLGWGEEPDKVEWRDEDTGLPCIARRGGSGAWCGYVAVSPGHPFHGLGYGSCPQECSDQEEKGYCCHTPEHVLRVHGGITFAAPCHEDDDHAVCHIPQDGESDAVWWFGFDCAHAGDFSPGHWKVLQKYVSDALKDYQREDKYRSLDYVQYECADLASQLADLDAS